VSFLDHSYTLSKHGKVLLVLDFLERHDYIEGSSGLYQNHLALSCLVVSSPVLTCLLLCCVVLCGVVLFCVASSYLVLSCVFLA
jgi:hypothetical protein